MITVGIVRESHFIAKSLNKTFHFSLTPDKTDLRIDYSIKPDGDLRIYIWQSGKGYFIWQENVVNDSSFFGPESVDSISRCIYCISHFDYENYKNYTYFEDPSQNPFLRTTVDS